MRVFKRYQRVVNIHTHALRHDSEADLHHGDYKGEDLESSDVIKVTDI